MMFRLAQAMVLVSGWRRRVVAMLAGACGALAMAPADVFPAMVVPMMAAVWLVDGSAHADPGGRPSARWAWRSVRSAADAGWWWGFGYFVAGLWWIGSAFLAESDKFVWLLPFGVLGLPAYLALFPALGFVLAHLFWTHGASRVLVLAVSLTAAEWLRGTVLTGFPWNEFGMALGGNLVLAQFASVVGVHGLTLMTVALAAAPATLCDPRPDGRGAALRPVLAALVGLASLAGYGAWRLHQVPPPAVPGVRLRVVQPNAAIDADFSYARKDAILSHYLTLSDRATSPATAGLGDVTHLVWPESPFPFILSRDADALAAIGATLPDKAVLVTGAARIEPGPATSGGAPATRYFNVIQVVADGGTIVDTYDKVHLVPFGEFLPLDPLLRAIGLTNFVAIPGGFEAGHSRRLLNVPGLPPVAAVICYEAIFSGEIVPPDAPQRGRRPGLILNVTNDSWFGFTPGPYQHFAQARLRAIEEGLPLARSASTGLSALVDPYGRILSLLPLGAENVLDGPLPGALPVTPFGRNANLIPLGLWAAVLAIALGTRRLP